MTRISRWAIALLSRALSADERDAVCGDLAERHAAHGETIRDLLGLAMRRQAWAWADWRAWPGLIVVAAFGLTLSVTSRQWANVGSTYGWLYANNWTWGYLESPGARLDLLRVASTFVLEAIALVGWSWSIGFAAASVSRRTAWVNGAVFALLVFGGTLGTASAAYRNPANAVVFSLPFYAIAVPALLRAAFVLLPALLGIQRAIRGTTLPLSYSIALGAAVVAVTACCARPLETALVWGWRLAPLRGDPLLHLLPLAMLGPVVYIAGTAVRVRWRRRSVLA
jgi:hypothetical protein